MAQMGLWEWTTRHVGLPAVVGALQHQCDRATLSALVGARAWTPTTCTIAPSPAPQTPATMAMGRRVGWGRGRGRGRGSSMEMSQCSCERYAGTTATYWCVCRALSAHMLTCSDRWRCSGQRARVGWSRRWTQHRLHARDWRRFMMVDGVEGVVEGAWLSRMS